MLSISVHKAGLNTSSASIDRIQSLAAASTTLRFAGPKPVQGMEYTWQPKDLHIATVLSVEPVSITTISSTQVKDEMQFVMFRASFFVMITAEILFTSNPINTNSYSLRMISFRQRIFKDGVAPPGLIGFRCLVLCFRCAAPQAIKVSPLRSLKVCELYRLRCASPYRSLPKLRLSLLRRTGILRLRPVLCCKSITSLRFRGS